jgi:hypothetical protein
MSYSYKSAREEFLSLFAKLIPNGRHADALSLLREATAEQRWNELYSSVDIGEAETARQEKRSEKREARVRALAEKLGCKLDAQGDPRGNPYLLLVGPQEHRLSIPAKGYPASFFERRR